MLSQAQKQPFHVSLFTYEPQGIPTNESVPQDNKRATGQYDENGDEIEEQLFYCYQRIVLAANEDEAEEKYLQHLRTTAVLPASYDVSVGVDEPEDHEDEDDDKGYDLIVVN
jgi:hypothetical protein